MSDLSPIAALPPAPTLPARRPSWWWRLTHRRATRLQAQQARLLADHHARTTERARAAQLDLARAGFSLGPVPFGYRPLRVTVPDSNGRHRRRIRLTFDPLTAPTVALIYQWCVDDLLDPTAIAHRLRAEPTWYPTRIDPTTRNPRPWDTRAVARILTNPVYTGATIWGRTHGGQPVPPDRWVICRHAHEPIIDARTFYRAQVMTRASREALDLFITIAEIPESDAPDPDPAPESSRRRGIE
ncbi:recombinase family protein [Frankia sp. KB5]|uniref:recombinase family protein n=1 Tax=Frankia sp. KB5 TaxID=683318 RepID=UPI000A10208C|nr:recombinase family protein [Frankia sp. KB5]ORT47122.1 recombinase [Frankia sp. KB5]